MPRASRGGATTAAASVTPGTVMARGRKSCGTSSQSVRRGETVAAAGEASAAGVVTCAEGTCADAVELGAAVVGADSCPGWVSHMTPPATTPAVTTATACFMRLLNFADLTPVENTLG